MRESSGVNAFVAVGLILLLVGGLGFVYGQVTMQQQAQQDGGLLDLSGDESQNGEAIETKRLVRVIGLFVGIAGGVMAVVGGLIT